ncbi:MAG TPA: CBS domain-containing protein [Planctomycetes bacterium]|nr:CBS domain-containing protein [Planctomycetota bacterium]
MKQIRELLTGRPPLVLPGHATALDAARSMTEEHVGAVLIQDEGRRCGMFTERDLMRRVVTPGLDPALTKLRDVMSTEIWAVTTDRRVNEVAREMQSRHVRHVPVTEDGKLIAVLSLRDLLRAHLEVKRGEVKALTDYIKGQGEGPVSSPVRREGNG